jgi:hypothetical protein
MRSKRGCSVRLDATIPKAAQNRREVALGSNTFGSNNTFSASSFSPYRSAAPISAYGHLRRFAHSPFRRFAPFLVKYFTCS